jgi:hypothetical protein
MLDSLHVALGELLDQYDVSYVGKSYGFLPHVTIQQGSPLLSNQKVVDSLALVELHGVRGTVRNVFQFGN